MNTEILENIGLTKAEINAYLALLELGSVTSGKIVAKSRVSSSKIYEILEKLMQKGLVSFIIKSGVKHFEAAPPERIMDYIKKKEIDFLNQKTEINKLLPELNLKKQLSKYKSEATIFKGMKGLETAFNDIFKTLKKGDCVYTFIAGQIDEKMNQFFSRHYKLRAEKGILTKTIFSIIGKRFYESRKDIKLFEGKIMPNASESPATINIYKDKVIIRIGDSEDVIAVVIENEKCARSFLEQFDSLWNQDVVAYKGFDDVMGRFESMLDNLSAGDEYYVLGATYGLGGNRIKDWFRAYHKERVRRGIKVKLLSVPEAHQGIIEQLKYSGDPNFKLAKIKSLSQEYSSPMQINLYQGKRVLMFLFGEEMVCFEIESEILYNNFMNYFNVLWS